MTGKDISPQYSVSKYPERYSEELETLKSFPDVRFGMREIEDAMKYLEEDRWMTSVRNAHLVRGDGKRHFFVL